jgi:diguanylate cyclase (GGDEF)-like protein/PAS domain S-box-containing protein
LRSEPLALHFVARRSVAGRFALGVASTLAGIALIELLILIGLPPLSPVAWSGLGMLAASAVGGLPAFLGGALTLSAYFVLNGLHPQRFPNFYAGAYNSLSWLVGLTLLVAVVLAVRPRLLRLAAAETELRARRQYEAALEASEERLRLVTDNLPAFVAYIDTDERYRMNNAVYEQWLGVPRERITGRTVREVWGEARYALFKPNMERALRGERVSHDYAATLQGRKVRVLATYVPDKDARGRVRGFFVLASDITELVAARDELHAAHDELREAHDRLAAALEGSNVALWDTDLRSGRVYLGEVWARIVGGPRQDSVATTDELMALLHPDDVEAVRRASLEALKGERPDYAVEHRVKARNGEWRWILSRGRVTERDPRGRALRMIGTNLDITERRRSEEAVQSSAHSDALTGLANRRGLGDRLGLALARNRRSGRESALLFLDVDNFKEVNDTLGHGAGDALLVEFAARLRASVRASDTVARFGGDEFVVLLEDVRERANALRIAEKILANARRPLQLDGREFNSTASIGVAYSDATSTEEDLLKRADAALYQAKAAGRDCYRVAL